MTPELMSWEQFGTHYADPAARIGQWAANVEAKLREIRTNAANHRDMLVHLEENTSAQLKSSSSIGAELQKAVLQLYTHASAKNAEVTDSLQRVVQEAEAKFATMEAQWKLHDKRAPTFSNMWRSSKLSTSSWPETSQGLRSTAPSPMWSWLSSMPSPSTPGQSAN